MGHGRPRTAIGTFGGFTFVSAPNGKVKARVRYRDDDGQLRLVQATGDSRKSAERALKAKLSQRASYASGYGALSADSSFTTLVNVWLDDLDLQGKLAQHARPLRTQHAAARHASVRALHAARDHCSQGRPVHQDARRHEELLHGQAGADGPQPGVRVGGSVRRAQRRTRSGTPRG